MKNIHILPTDKPSKLLLSGFGTLFLTPPMRFKNSDTYQHIYITSDEEIKEGDWYYDTKDLESLVPIYQRSQNLKFYSGCKKIILTTDQDLIKDGVQSIDDEFLEWFIKNPSCEFVETKLFEFEVDMGLDESCIEYGNYYKIIIPKEDTYERTTQSISLSEVDKQETLEEAAENYIKELDVQHYISQEDFILGAKWQAERMYSEEEILAILHNYRNHFELYINLQVLPDMFFGWFEQFKKK